MDKKGEPWFATYSSVGLVSVDVEKRSITSYGESKGLLHNDINTYLNGKLLKMHLGGFGYPHKEDYRYLTRKINRLFPTLKKMASSLMTVDILALKPAMAIYGLGVTMVLIILYLPTC